MRNIKYSTDDVIFNQGEEAGKMYKIVKGKVGVYSGYNTDKEKHITALSAGRYFGEMGVIEDMPRSATVVAESEVEVIEIDAESFPQFVAGNASDIIEMMSFLSESIRKTTKLYLEASKEVDRYVEQENERKVSVWKKFARIAGEYKNIFGSDESSQAVVKEKYSAGEIIFKKGQKGSNMYKVLSGEVAFYLNYGDADSVELSKIGKGELFGEMAVIDSERRSATAVAVTDITLKSIVNSQFEDYITAYPEDAMKILRNLSSKLRGTTEKYIEVLKTISEYVDDNKNDSGNGGLWDSFIKYSAMYNEFNANAPGECFPAFYMSLYR